MNTTRDPLHITTRTEVEEGLMKRCGLLVLILLVVPGAQTLGDGIGLKGGDVVFLMDDAGNGPNNLVMRADPSTGDRSVISQPGVRGLGPDFGSLIIGLRVDAQKQILVTGFDANAVFRVDPLTGDRTIVSGDMVGTGPALDGADSMEIGASGEIYVTTTGAKAIFRIDPITGDRSIVSGPGVGSGPLITPTGLVRTTNNDFYAFDSTTDAVYFVNGVTGDRTAVSGGAGPPISSFAGDMTQLWDGALAAVDKQRRVLRIDPATHAHSILSDDTVGSGPLFSGSLLEINPGLRESLIVTAGSSVRNIYRVDPITGNRILISGDSRGSGLSLGTYRDAVEVVPEPSTLTMSLVAMVSTLLLYLRTQRTRRA